MKIIDEQFIAALMRSILILLMSALFGLAQAQDQDLDGVPDEFDNCVLAPNGPLFLDAGGNSQLDTDGDGHGNLCDPDFNGNGIVDPGDFSLLKARFGQSGAPDQDLNGNGIVDPFDFSLLKAMFGQPPGPSGTEQIPVDIGSGLPPAFVSGIIAVATPGIAAGESTDLTVTLVTAIDTLYTESVTVNFTSPCIATGLASISGPTTTATGVLTVSYDADGCSGDDIITASSTINNVLVSATGTVNVAPATIDAIEFEAAVPTVIGFGGTGSVGIPETSTVVFRVVDDSGGPVSGHQVDFSLNTTAGGISLLPASAVSGTDGRVQTVVQSGTVATTVRVTATVVDVTPNIAVQSDELTITSGIPDQDSFSLAVEAINVEGWHLDGTVNPVTVRLADRFNNPVIDFIAVSFGTEGGNIGGSCFTTTTPAESGICTVNWVSQNPRPVDLPAGGPFTSRAGRSTIYAWTTGEESFTDNNGNGFFDDGDTFTDIGEPFLDENENGIYDFGEPYVDFDSNFVYTLPDGLYSGLLCGGPGGTLDTAGRCAPNPTVAISASNLIIMSGSFANISVTSPNPHDASGDNVCYWIRDLNDQPLPAGTTISAFVSNSAIVGPTSYTVPSASDDSEVANTYCFAIAESPLSAPASGSMFLTVVSPSGLQTIDSSVFILD